MEARRYVPNELLGRLVRSRLYSVNFVYDYVQLQFDRPDGDLPILTCDAMPTVAIVNGTYTDVRPGYADALRSLITATLLSTNEATGTGLSLELDTGSLTLHPTPVELTGPEIANLTGFTDGQWMCWRPGEDSFEDLA